MSLYTAAGKAKTARRTGGHAGSSGLGVGGGGVQGSSSRPDISDEQRQEIREAFDLFVSNALQSLYTLLLRVSS